MVITIGVDSKMKDYDEETKQKLIEIIKNSKDYNEAVPILNDLGFRTPRGELFNIFSLQKIARRKLGFEPKRIVKSYKKKRKEEKKIEINDKEFGKVKFQNTEMIEIKKEKIEVSEPSEEITSNKSKEQLSFIKKETLFFSNVKTLNDFQKIKKWVENIPIELIQCNITGEIYFFPKRICDVLATRFEVIKEFIASTNEASLFQKVEVEEGKIFEILEINKLYWFLKIINKNTCEQNEIKSKWNYIIDLIYKEVFSYSSNQINLNTKKDCYLHLSFVFNKLAEFEEKSTTIPENIKEDFFSKEGIPAKTSREKIVEICRAYAISTKTEYEKIFKLLYKEFRIRYKIDLIKRAKNKNLETLDFAEQKNELIDTLYNLALNLFIKKGK